MHFVGEFHKQYGVYFEYKQSFIIPTSLNFKSFSRFDSDPEANDKPMCHHASLFVKFSGECFSGIKSDAQKTTLDVTFKFGI